MGSVQTVVCTSSPIFRLEERTTKIVINTNILAKIFFEKLSYICLYKHHSVCDNWEPAWV